MRFSNSIKEEGREYARERRAKGSLRVRANKYGAIVRAANGWLMRRVMEGEMVELPYGMGTLCLAGVPTTVMTGKDGLPICTRQVDVEATRRNIAENPEIGGTRAQWVFHDERIRLFVMWVCPAIRNAMMFVFLPDRKWRREARRLALEEGETVRYYDYRKVLESAGIGPERLTYVNYGA